VRGARAPGAFARAGLSLWVLALASSCAGPPWFMGSPLDGRPSMRQTRANLSFKDQRRAAATARARGETVLELRALIALDDVERLLPEQRARLGLLLERRAAELHALGRAIPESRDLARLARLSSADGARLSWARAAADRDAGDAWLAVGAVDDARACYERAAALGATDVDFRVRALWGHPPPATTSLAELRAAIVALPLRAIPPFATAYVARGGADRATLGRGLAAARQEKDDVLAQRLGEALNSGATVAPEPMGPEDAGAGDGGDVAVQHAGSEAPPQAPLPSDLDEWVLRGATVSARLLPLVRTRPEVLDDVERAVGWIDLLLAEDETSTEILELAAIVFGRASRLGGTERMLMELAYATPDRAEGLARGAAVWERLGRGREACAQWIRAARWRDDPEDPTWRKAVSCARKDPGVGDWRQIRGYVLDRARPDRRAALAASLDDGSP
jgi:hypothetical protein